MGAANVHAERLRNLAGVFTQLNEKLQHDTLPTIHEGLQQLEDEWMGVSRHRYDGLYYEWSLLVERLCSLNEDVTTHLKETASRFDKAARDVV
ncbi:MAG TPA: hypothetical protein VHZ51_03910 [Ktedonobacteraceae bacterium]|nr:hypothetical protein [Ktedonobacteraceae bacterium]